MTEKTLKPISIWQPQKVNGEQAFVRPVSLPLGDHYADRKTIFKNKPPQVKRICFFGESAAAGYLYAPHLTPAKVLESQLLQICGKPQFEVIDLAMTNETLDGLTAKVESALQLEPDVLVIFTGNNWTMLETPELSPYFPSLEARLEYARMLREEGINGVINQASLRVLQKAAATFARIGQAARPASIPVILVIPEVNLADWENRQAPVWLPGDKTAKWYLIFQKNLDYLQNEDWQNAETTAWQLEGLDGCTCPTTYRLLAKAFLGMGAEHKARQACQAEVDSNRYPTLCFLGAPQINSGGKALLKRVAQRHGFSLVDLPDVFARHTGSALPGRRMFLDYCHLTAEGMGVAMSAVAGKVLGLIDGVAPSHSVNPTLPAVSPEADATAKFGAAIHTAHRHLAVGDENPILEYWCREALAASPGIRQAMSDFVLARTAQVPAVLTAAQQRNFSSPYKLTMQHGWKYDYLDAAVIKAIEVAGTPAGFETLPGLTHQDGTDIIHPPYFLWKPVERFYPEVMEVTDLPGRAFFRAAWHESSFALFCPPESILKLEMTLRLPRIPGWDGKRKGYVFVKINGQGIGSVQVEEQWKKAVFSFKNSASRFRLLPLTLGWPPLPPCGSEAIEGAVRRLERGMEADLHPVFGEVFSLKVFPAP